MRIDLTLQAVELPLNPGFLNRFGFGNCFAVLLQVIYDFVGRTQNQGTKDTDSDVSLIDAGRDGNNGQPGQIGQKDEQRLAQNRQQSVAGKGDDYPPEGVPGVGGIFLRT